MPVYEFRFIILVFGENIKDELGNKEFNFQGLTGADFLSVY
jgi:hypothetical protein